MIESLCLIAYPRTDSNRICEVIGSIPNVNGKYEIFHPHNAWGVKAEEIEYINSQIGSNFLVKNNSNDPNFSNYRRQSPVDFLCHLRNFSEQAGYRFIFFKLFSNHLSFDNLLALVNAQKIHFGVLTRGTIDTYISLLKAQIVGKYNKVDTTDVIPEISNKNFLNFQEELVYWYSSSYLLAATSHKPAVIRYEDLFRSSNIEIERIFQFFPVLGLQKSPSIAKAQGLERQDKATDWRKIISNPSEIEALISQQRVVLDIARMLN